MAAVFCLGEAGVSAPLDIGMGPQLFVDEHLIAESNDVRREIRPPRPLPEPVLDHATFGTSQNHLTVLRDAAGGRYRAWYNREHSIWHAESRDGIAWTNPQSVLEVPYGFGASVVDDGPHASDPSRRFKLAHWRQLERNKPGDDSGMWVAFSPDGLRWTVFEQNPVLPTWPEGVGVRVAHRTSDIIDVFHDAELRRYLAFVKLPAVADDGYEPGPRAGALFRRLVGLSTSSDFVEWSRPVRVFQPDDRDKGLLEFYGMAGVHRRGSLYIGLVRILHDEMSAEPGGPKNGVGYTVLATSRDGINWTRMREPFLTRNASPQTWDRAVAWGCAALVVGDETFIYYNGRARGHKVSPDDRQFGLARMKRDRYAAMVPKKSTGKLRTRTFIVPRDATRLSVNADATRGELKVRVLNVTGDAFATPGHFEARPFRGDAIAGEVRWERSLTELRSRAVQLEFDLHDAALFGFEFHP